MGLRTSLAGSQGDSALQDEVSSRGVTTLSRSPGIWWYCTNKDVHRYVSPPPLIATDCQVVTALCDAIFGTAALAGMTRPRGHRRGAVTVTKTTRWDSAGPFVAALRSPELSSHALALATLGYCHEQGTGSAGPSDPTPPESGGAYHLDVAALWFDRWRCQVSVAFAMAFRPRQQRRQRSLRVRHRCGPCRHVLPTGLRSEWVNRSIVDCRRARFIRSL